MSRFSGKCDFYDCAIEIHGYTLEELQNNVKIYVGDSKEPLQIHSMEDLIPYYPYIITSAGYDNVKRTAVIHLSGESFVDIEEREMLEFKLIQVVNIYRKCKEENREFTLHEIEIAWPWVKHADDALWEITRRVQKYGEAATIDGLHDKLHNRYREELQKEIALANNITK